MDEARIGQKGRTCHRWYEKGERPPGRVDQRFASAWLYAAIRPKTGEDVTLALPTVSAEVMDVFLAHFGQSLAAGVHALVVLDQAGWHDVRALQVPANITLVPLPSYSPALNPVERIWLYVRERFLSHRLHLDQDAVLEAACAAWRRLVSETGRLKTLCAYPWIAKVAS